MTRLTQAFTRALALISLVAMFHGAAQADDPEASASGVSHTPVFSEGLSESPGRK